MLGTVGVEDVGCSCASLEASAGMEGWGLSLGGRVTGVVPSAGRFRRLGLRVRVVAGFGAWVRVVFGSLGVDPRSAGAGGAGELSTWVGEGCDGNAGAQYAADCWESPCASRRYCR